MGQYFLVITVGPAWVASRFRAYVIRLVGLGGEDRVLSSVDNFGGGNACKGSC